MNAAVAWVTEHPVISLTAAAVGIGTMTTLLKPQGAPLPEHQPDESLRALGVPGKGDTWLEEDWLTFQSPRCGTRLHTYRYPVLKGKKERGLVFLWHGWNEHMGRHAHVASQFANQGLVAFGCDMFGHGRSDGLRGYIESFDHFVDDALAYVDEVRKHYPSDLPIFLYGCSMGGMMCCRLALRRPDLWSGMALAAPAVKAQEDLHPFLQKVSGYLAALAPKLPVVALPPGLGSRNPACNEDFRDDPLCHKGWVRAGTGHSLLQSCLHITDNVEDIKTPFIVIQGELDKLVDHKGSYILHERASSTDKDLKFYPGVWHDVIHEPEWEEITGALVQWCSERAAQ